MPSIEHLIIGASVRAAVQSARRCGIQAWGVDLFHDRDTCSIGEPLPPQDYPDGFAERITQLRPRSCSYTGGLENYPALIASLAQKVPLWGNDAGRVQRIRDPAALRDFVQRHRFSSAWPSEQNGSSWEGRFLLKRARSSGGLGVRAIDRGSPRDRRLRHDFDHSRREWERRGYDVQMELPGSVYGASFFAGKHQAHLLGICQTLAGTGIGPLDPKPFAYRGSIGPVQLDRQTTTLVQAIGQRLVEDFELQGVFGVDFIWWQNQIWLLEVNPRWPASLEILERSLGKSLFELISPNRPTVISPPDDGGELHGKLVWYWGGPTDFRMTDEIGNAMMNEAAVDRDTGDDWSTVADIPRTGTLLERGQPVVTLFARGDSVSQVIRQLEDRRQYWNDRIRCELTE